jgi:hypothetical protein
MAGNDNIMIKINIISLFENQTRKNLTTLWTQKLLDYKTSSSFDSRINVENP